MCYNWVTCVVLLDIVFGSSNTPTPRPSLFHQDLSLVCELPVNFVVYYNSNERAVLASAAVNIVFLRGEDARSEAIGRDESLDFSLGSLVSTTEAVSGEFQQFSVYSILNNQDLKVYYDDTASLICVDGPGVLYTSKRLAFFTNNDCVIDALALSLSKLHAILRKKRQSLDDSSSSGDGQSSGDHESSGNGQPPLVVGTVQVQVNPQITSEGASKSVLVVSEVFTMTLTGASTMRLDTGQTQAISYSNEILTVTSGDGRRDSAFPAILRLATVQVMAKSEPQLIIYSSNDDITLLGACQVYVNTKEGVSFYVQNFVPQTGNNVADVINEEVFQQVFQIQIMEGGEARVTDVRNNTIISVTSITRRHFLPSAERVLFYGEEQFVTVKNRDSDSVNVSAVHTLSVYRNNELKVFKSNTSLDIRLVNITLSNGGTLYVNDTEGTALFASNSNPAVSQQIDGAASLVSVGYSYSTEVDSAALYTLVVRQNGTSTEVIMVLTGAEVLQVSPHHIVSYNDDEITIHEANGRVLTCLPLTKRLVVSNGATTLATYTGFSAIPFSGPGTLIVNRGIGFFTTDEPLGQSILTVVTTAPVPVVDFEIVQTGSNVIDGITYRVAAVKQRIGGDIVAVYEAKSYDVSEEQIIVYNSGLVSVHHSTMVSGEGISYIGNQSKITYANFEGAIDTLTGVDKLHVFSGGNIEIFSTADNFSLSVSGKLFVSRSGEALFTTSETLTSNVAGLLRRLVPASFSVDVDQFSSVSSGVFQLSKNLALVTFSGGGTIWQRASNGTTYALYVNNERITRKIIQAVSTGLGITKSTPAKDFGLLRIIFNGRSIYSYLAIPRNRDIIISRTESFILNDTTISGRAFTREGINEIISFDGMEVKAYNSTTTPVVFTGPGLLLVQAGSDTAFYTTWSPTVNYILESVARFQQRMVPPRIEKPRTENVRTKLRSTAVMFGANVRAFKGSNISFVCKVIASFPAPLISVFREGQNNDLTLITSSNDSMELVFDLVNISDTDAGGYSCRVDNGVPPAVEETSRLLVREAVAPVLTPGWLPSVASREHAMHFLPSSPPTVRTFNVQLVKHLQFLCWVDGCPRAEVVWQLNDGDVSSVLRSGVAITEVGQGRSILTVNVEGNEAILRGENEVKCSAENAGGQTSGSVVIQGISYTCVQTGNGTCSTTCGIGVQRREFECVKTQAEGITEAVAVNEVPEEILSQGHRIRVCTPTDSSSNPIICPLTVYRWNTSEWSECSKTCSMGSRTRNVTCLHVSIPLTSQYQSQLDEATETVANEEHCIMFNGAGERPADNEPCNQQRCPIWQVSQYSECSVTCGGGVVVRSVTCNVITGQFRNMQEKTQNNLTVVNETLCNLDDRPVDTRPCKRGRCPYEWRLGQFKECGAVPLSEEFRFCRQRDVFCYNTDPNLVTGTKRQVPLTFCADQKQPISLASCGGGRCFNGIWEALPWGQCSKSCGYGIRLRVIQCLSPLSLTVVAAEFCDSATMPSATSLCFVHNCGMCMRDESPLCPLLARSGMCGMPVAMGDDGLRCCVSCRGMAGRELI